MARPEATSGCNECNEALEVARTASRRCDGSRWWSRMRWSMATSGARGPHCGTSMTRRPRERRWMRHRLSANGDPQLDRATGRDYAIVAAMAGLVLRRWRARRPGAEREARP